MSEKPYLPSRSNEFDDAEWDRWMTLTEEQANAEVEAADREFADFVNAMTPLEAYRFWRRYILISIMENRRRLVDPKLARIAIVDQMFRDGIKKSQHSLLKHRHHLRTGVWPGEA
jgi:hypothetical protein